MIAWVAVLLAGRLAVAASPSVVLTAGDPSPIGLPFSAFPAVAIDARGRVVAIGASSGAFRRAAQGPQRILVAGDVLPSGEMVVAVGAVAQDEAGCAIVRAALRSGAAALFRRCGTESEILLRSGAEAPGGEPVVDLVGPVAVAGAHVAVGAVVEGGRTLLLRLSGTSIVRIASVGDPAPRGGAITSLRLLGVSADGWVGFRVAVSGGRDGFLRGDGLRVEPVVIVGDAVGGLGEGGTIGSLGGATVNAANTWAFRASMETLRGTLTGVFRVNAAGASPRVEPLALEGKDAGEPGVVFRSFPSSLVPSINAEGVVAFRATLAGGDTGSAVFTVAPGGSLRRIVGTREPTPVGSLVRFRDPVIADDGSLCISASRTGIGPGLYVHRDGTLLATPLAQQGERTDVDTGQERFRFFAPAVRAKAEEAMFLGSREGLFRVGTDGRVTTLAFVGGPTPLGGTYARIDPPAAGLGAVAFTVEVAGGRAGRALLRIAAQGGPRVIAASGDRAPRGGRFVDFLAGGLDTLERPAVGLRDEVAFEASVQGGRVSRGVFRKASGAVRLVVGSNGPVPGGGRYVSFGTPTVLRGGALGFVAQVDSGSGASAVLILQRGRRGRRLMTAQEVLRGRLPGTVQSLDPPQGQDRVVVWRATLVEQTREGIFAHLLGEGRTTVVVGSGDPAPGGGTFRSFERPLVAGDGLVFLGRLAGSATAGLFRAAFPSPAGADGASPAVSGLLLPGTPLGGGERRVKGILGVDANRAGLVVASVETIGELGPAAVVVTSAVP